MGRPWSSISSSSWRSRQRSLRIRLVELVRAKCALSLLDLLQSYRGRADGEWIGNSYFVFILNGCPPAPQIGPDQSEADFCPSVPPSPHPSLLRLKEFHASVDPSALRPTLVVWARYRNHAHQPTITTIVAGIIAAGRIHALRDTPIEDSVYEKKSVLRTDWCYEYVSQEGPML